ncbi:twin-arginine translocation signal domain-containing protein [Plantactinospora sp. WMMB334]|uniref:twin-arginine translocation signal domain-containing protein n=1 Tax=Plantactinospora sp. WMMB334 TaxID=3404119 RepID=UPI003B924EE3
MSATSGARPLHISRRGLLTGAAATSAAVAAGALLPGRAFALDGGWTEISDGGMTTSAPAVVAFNGNDHNFIRGLDNRIFWNYQRKWVEVPAYAPGDAAPRTEAAPAAVVYQGQIWLFHTGQNRAVYHATYNGVGWSRWTETNNWGNVHPQQSVAVTVLPSRPNQLWIALRHSDNGSLSIQRVIDGRPLGRASIRDWNNGHITSPDAPAIVADHHGNVIVASRLQDGRLRTTRIPQSTNLGSGGWPWFTSGMYANTQPHLYVADNNKRAYAVVRGLDNGIWLADASGPVIGGSWKVTNDQVIASPVLAHSMKGERLYAVTANPHSRIFWRSITF